MAKEDKIKALEAAISNIERSYGKGAIMKLGDPSASLNVETIPTGSISLDVALGMGGVPKGRIIEDRKSTRLNSSHPLSSRMPSSA